MLAASWLFVPLVYGAPYRASVPPLLILLPGVISMGIFKVLTRNFTSRNRQQISILASSVALVLIVSLNLFLIPRWGVAGAALASTIGYTAAGMVLLTFFLRDSKLPWQEVLLPRRSELVGHLYWAKERFQERW
jgi:O-antigen/teichoic acid export membrane protein